MEVELADGLEMGQGGGGGEDEPAFTGFVLEMALVAGVAGLPVDGFYHGIAVLIGPGKEVVGRGLPAK